MRLLAVVLAVAGVFGVRAFFRGPGDDVLLPEGSHPDWRERAKRSSA